MLFKNWQIYTVISQNWEDMHILLIVERVLMESITHKVATAVNVTNTIDL